MSASPMPTPAIATISIPADAQFLRTVRQVVGVAAACVPDRVDDVRLAVNEAIGLALAEGCERVEVTIATTPDALTISVPVQRLPDASDPDEVNVMALIEALADVADFTSGGLTLSWVTQGTASVENSAVD